MHSSNDRLLAGVLAAAVLLVALLVITAPDGPERVAAVGRPSAELSSLGAPGRAAGQPAELAALPRRAAWTAHGEPEPVEALAPEPAPSERRRVRLRVLFSGEPIELDRTRLEVSPLWRSGRGPYSTEGFSLKLGDEHLIGYVRGGAQVELDVSTLFRFAEPQALVLRSESEGLQGLAVVACEGVAGGGESAEALIVSSLWMDAGTSVSGRVVPEGHGQLGVFLVLDGSPVGVLVEEGVVRSDGGFELELPGNNAYALCAFRRDQRPGTAVFGLGYSERYQLPAVHLPEAEAIRGSLSLMDTCERATVTARLKDGAGHYVVGTSDFVWYEGGFEWRSRSSPGGGDCGSFLLTGLAPGIYELAVSGVRNRDQVSVGRVPTVTAWAPAAGVDLSPRLARVRLQLEHDGLPLQGTNHSVSLVQDFGARGTSHLHARTTDDGVAEFWLDPEAPAWVRGQESTRFLPADLDGRAPKKVPGEPEAIAGTGGGY